MKRHSGCALALALMAMTANGQSAPPAAPPGAGPTTAGKASDQSTREEEKVGAASHWWTFDDSALLTGLGVDPDAGLFGLGRWRTVLDLRAIGHAQETRSDFVENQKFYSYLTSEGITFRNSGWYLLDPRLLTGTASIRFGYQQARQDASTVETAQDGNVTDYYFDLLLFSQKPLNAMLQASHSEFATSQAGGGTTFAAHTLQGATLSLREASLLRDKEIAPYFSATMYAGNEDLDETTTNAGQQFRRVEHRKDLRFDAHNGFETGDLTMALDQIDLTNEAFASGSFRSRNASLYYGVDFGRTLTSHSDLHLNYNDRTGDSATEMLDVQQRLYFEHTAFLSSGYGYLLQDIQSIGADSKVQRLDASVQYRPFLNVSTDSGVSATRTEFTSGSIESEGGNVGISYSHWLPAGGVLNASVSGSLTYTNSQIPSGTVPVVDERYQAPPVLGAGAGFLLKNADVVTESIVVVNVRGGARLPTSVGIDYEVELEGNRTKIVPLASSAVIQAGDPLEVSYQYLVDPSLESRIDDRSYYLSGDWQWIAVSLTHDVSNQEPLSGQQSTLLSDQERTSLRLDLRRDWGNWRGRGNARAARYRDERLDYDEIRLGENLSWQPSYDWELNADANQGESRFRDTGRVSRTFDSRLGGSWHSRRGWWTDGYVLWRTRQDSVAATETITEGFVRVRRNWPQLIFSASLGVGMRDRESVQTTYENFQLSLSRTF